jgi:predicted ATP-grasp superfamily ATP-dependent carboligase/protein-S-isoprenylcysteine O-methyltransferase Ste14
VHGKPLTSLSAFVLDAQDSHALAAIRSLGRQGARVTAVSPKPDPMGAQSRWCHQTLRSPHPATEPDAFADWLLTTLERRRPDALLFFGEASANAVAQHGDAIRALTGCLVPAHDTFLTADRKDRVTRLAAGLGLPVPATHDLDPGLDVAALRDRLAFPVVVKAVSGSGGHQVRFVRTADRFLEAVRQVAGPGAAGGATRGLVQEYVDGVGYGFTALAERGSVVAAFMHRRLAEHDIARGARLAHAATGAVSVDEPELRASGVALLRALAWDGMAMVEFRRSRRDGRFYLMEVNPRFPGSLDLAIAAGVDFPALYVQRAVGRPVTGPERYPIGLRYRWILSKGVGEAVEDPLGYARGVASVLRPDTRCDVRLDDARPHVVQVREAAWWLRHSVHDSAAAGALRRAARASHAGLARGRAGLAQRRVHVPVAFSGVILAAMHGFTYPGGEHRLDLAWEGVCLLLGLLGLALRVATVGFSARDAAAGDAGAAPALDTTGMYSVMQHPDRFGTLLMWLAVALFPRRWWLPELAIVAFWLHSAPVLRAEERALRRRFGMDYVAWAAQTPRFLPRWSRWQRPRAGFSFDRVLRGEPTALFVLVSCFTFLETVGELNITRHFEVDVEWAGIFAATVVAYATLFVLRQRRVARP